MLSSSETDQLRGEVGIESSFEPIGDLTAVAGYAASWQILSSEADSTDKTNHNNLLQLATKILNDPQMQTELGNRVYQLMKEDLYRQKERRIG